MLAQEPWCYTPEQIGRLTDWQIEFLYARPALERSERMAPGKGKGTGKDLGSRRPEVEASTGPPGEPGSPQHRAACIDAYMTVQGLNRERAEAQYEKQLAQFRSGKW